MFETMQLLRSIVSVLAPLCVLTGFARHAGADPEPGARPSGAQDEQPVRPVTERRTLAGQADERAAVRGCPLGSTCTRWQDELREFELEQFSPTGSPWLDGEAHRAPAGGRDTRPKKPTDLRPDLPWLAELELPDLPVVWDERVIDYLVFYKDDPRGQRIMRGWLEAQGRYHDIIVGALRQAHLPEDLIYVSMIESSYNPTVHSYAGASGPWQFMPSAGRIYGLTIDGWIDERNDPIRSTEAALGMWADLYERFGDWDLAMAAYNAGFGAVLKAIARFNTNDFWALLDYEDALPWESSIYVPKALATAIVGHNRALFGFGDIKDQPAERWDDVTVPTSIALATIAQAAGCKVADLQRLNPHLRRGRTPPGRGFVVRVPAGDGAQFEAKLGQLRGDWDQYDVYVMRYGERFEDVATQFGVTTAKLKALNELDSEAEVTGGTLLVVPRVAAEVRAKNLATADDNLYGSGVDHRPGEALIVAVPDKDAVVDGKRRVFYRVVNGDSLASVGDALGVSADTLAGWNGVERDARLQSRMVLEAWMDPTWSEDAANVRLLDETRIILVTRGSLEHVELSEARTGRERGEYTAKKKESFEQIGARYGLGKRDMARINRKPPDTIVQPGETVVIYKVVDHTRSARAEKQWRKTPRPARAKGGKKHVAAAPAGARTAAADPHAPAPPDGPVTTPE